jgi:hypothetical protein
MATHRRDDGSLGVGVGGAGVEVAAHMELVTHTMWPPPGAAQRV